MSGPWIVVLTACLSAFFGVIGYIIKRFFVESICRLRSLISEIADSLAFYAPVYSNPSGVIDYQGKSYEATQKFQRQATQLMAGAHAIPWYPLWSFLRVVQAKRKIEDASKELIGLSNTVHQGPLLNYGTQTDAQRKRIEKLLGIRRSK